MNNTSEYAIDLSLMCVLEWQNMLENLITYYSSATLLVVSTDNGF